MGGGDLNLKKSWHPQTLRNVEKVWKAEQKHEAKQGKMEELQRRGEDPVAIRAVVAHAGGLDSGSIR